jgi:hypothetical protein
MDRIENILNDTRASLKKAAEAKPRYTVIYHPIREELGLSLTEYCIIDSIHKLSTLRSEYPWCSKSKRNLAKFLGFTERTIFRALALATKKGLIEKNDRGDVRTTLRWREKVEIYEHRETRRQRL